MFEYVNGRNLSSRTFSLRVKTFVQASRRNKIRSNATKPNDRGKPSIHTPYIPISPMIVKTSTYSSQFLLSCLTMYMPPPIGWMLEGKETFIILSKYTLYALLVCCIRNERGKIIVTRPRGTNLIR